MEVYSSEWAENYERLANAGIPGREGLYRICQASFQSLPAGASILIVGCGTGVETLQLAEALPNVSFVAVDPAQPMLDFCARQVEAQGFDQRVSLHAGTLDSLPSDALFDAATAILVSQHISEDADTEAFFQNIVRRLKPGGYLYSADLHIAAGQNREKMIALWQDQALMAGIETDVIEALLMRFESDLRVRDEETIINFLQKAGFVSTLKPFSSLLYGAWLSQRCER